MRTSQLTVLGFRRSRTLGAGAVTTALLASLLVPVAQAAPPAAVDRAVAVKRGAVVSERPDEVSASMAARAQGSRVEVTGARSAVARTWANPDGTFSSEQFSGPSWTRDATGTWVEIDTTLVSDDQGVRPRASGVQVDLSRGVARPAGDGLAQVAQVSVPRDALAQLASAFKTGDPARMPVSSIAGEKTAGFAVGLARRAA